jgi:prepilin-type N-terminal cleavage/methylation domain-containing protein
MTIRFVSSRSFRGTAKRLVDRRLRTGFSIPEMLAVVALIVIILALLLPALQSAREPAYAAICENNLHQIMMACHVYATNNKSFMPFPNWGGWGKDLGGAWKDGGWLYDNENNETWNTDAHWTEAVLRSGVIFQYHNNVEMYRCPKEKSPFPRLSGQITSYNMNGSVCGYGSNLTFRRSQFKSSNFILWEVDPFVTSAGWWWDGANHPNEGISTEWHQLGGTLVAMDGHCEWMQYDAYVAAKSISGRNDLWNAPDTANGH